MWNELIPLQFLVFASIHTALCQNSETLRLANSSKPTEGRLEIFHNGTWGTVCDHGFDSRDASVACYSLGFEYTGQVLAGNRYGPGLGRIWLDDVTCSGNEATLSSCRHNDWGLTHCLHSEDVSISCHAEGSLRLVGAEREGRLEIYHNNEWGTVCNHVFSNTAAKVACNTLGYGYTGRMLSSYQYQFPTTTQRIWVHYTTCTGTEPQFSNCSLSWSPTDCNHYSDVIISCVPPARLVNGNSTEGRLEVYHSGQWGTVCGTVFDDITASVACYSLGFGHVGRVIGNTHGQGTGTVWLQDVVCSGYETMLDDCRIYTWGYTNCNHTNDVSISCQNTTNPSYNSTAVRLSGASVGISNEGRLEVFYGGTWGTVCDDYFTQTIANIACRSLNLGLRGEFIGNYYGSGRGRIWTIRCTGSETSLDQCSFTSAITSCSHWEDVSIACRTNNATVNGTNLRLVGSNSSREGRLEILHAGSWGTICDDDFDDTDARVACYSLGFGYVGETLQNLYGAGSSYYPIWLDNVECIGYETTLDECSHNPWGSHNCGHHEDVSISCHNYSNVDNGTQLRLVGSTVNPREGRLEVYHSGIWGTVCNDGFDDRDARVACYGLGFGRIGTSLYSQFGSGTGRIWLSNLACTGNETFIGDCRHNGWGRTYCSHYQDVSISCANYTENEVRLVGTSAVGRLEIYYGGSWGTVCSDAFNDIDAKVACRSLGYGFVGRTLHKRPYMYGTAPTMIWLDGVQCIGTETGIHECPHDPWGVNDCYHTEDVFISCATNTTTISPASPVVTMTFTPSSTISTTTRLSPSSTRSTPSTTTTTTTTTTSTIKPSTTHLDVTTPAVSSVSTTIEPSSSTTNSNNTNVNTSDGSSNTASLAIGLVCVIVVVVVAFVAVLIYRRRRIAVAQSQMLLFQSATEPDEPDVRMLVA